MHEGREDRTDRRLADQIRMACLLEATARKPGNVHPEAAFADVSYADFVRSADAAAPSIAMANRLGVGVSVLRAIEATHAAVGRNTNLGLVLLLAPLAAVDPSKSLQEGIGPVLDALSIGDATAVYEAIRLANPAALGRVSAEDISSQPTRTLKEVMGLAAKRDRVARQYVCDFADVLDVGLGLLRAWLRKSADWETVVIGTYLDMLKKWPDSFIARKLGPAMAEEVSRRAADVVARGWPDAPEGQSGLRELDAWLREDGNRRSPGTTADLVGATLFAAIREGGSSAAMLLRAAVHPPAKPH